MDGGEKTHHPGTSSATSRQLLGPPSERGRGAGRGASPGPAGCVSPPRPGCASPPRRRRAARGPSEPSAARSRERERERGRACSRQPARAASGAVPRARSWNLKRQARRGRGALAGRGARRTPQAPGRTGPSGPGEKSFLRGGRPQPPLPSAEPGRRERVGGISPSRPGDPRGSDLYAQQVLHLFSAAPVSVRVRRLFH